MCCKSLGNSSLFRGGWIGRVRVELWVLLQQSVNAAKDSLKLVRVIFKCGTHFYKSVELLNVLRMNLHFRQKYVGI